MRWLPQRGLRRGIAVATIIGVLSVATFAQEPGYDTECRVPSDARAQRIAVLKRNIEVSEAGIRSAETSLEELQKIERQVRFGYAASNVAEIIGTIASVVSGVMIVRALVTKSALILFGHVMSVGGALTMTGTRTAAIGGSLYVLFKKKSLEAQSVKLTVDGKPLEATSLDDLLAQQLENTMSEAPLIPAKLPLLTVPVCSGKLCELDQPRISALFTTLEAWDELEEKHAKELDAWWKPDASTHLFGETISKIEIPYARNGIRIMKLQLDYFRALERALEHDQTICDAHVSLAAVPRLLERLRHAGGAAGAACGAR